jgi:hypothetical protein
MQCLRTDMRYFIVCVQAGGAVNVAVDLGAGWIHGIDGNMLINSKVIHTHAQAFTSHPALLLLCNIDQCVNSSTC